MHNGHNVRSRGAQLHSLWPRCAQELARVRCRDGVRVPPATAKPDFEAQLGTGMARDKLEEGVATFARDAKALEDWLAKLKAEEA